MGNHERKHLGWSKEGIKPALSQMIAHRQFGEDRYPEALAFMASFPLLIDLPEALSVHAFLEPGIQLEKQRDNVLVGTLSAELHLKKNYPRPWYEYYEDPKPLIVGHLNYTGSDRPLVHRDLIYAIDTGCCRGGELTGVMLPDFRILSVPARNNHWKAVVDRNSDLARHLPDRNPGL